MLARPKRDAHFYELAKRGAEARLRELGDELKLLFSAFPDLRKSFDPEELPIAFILKRSGGRPSAGARVLRLSAAEKSPQGPPACGHDWFATRYQRLSCTAADGREPPSMHDRFRPRLCENLARAAGPRNSGRRRRRG